MRILIVSNNHPEVCAGGSERAAYSLFRLLKAEPSVERAIFLAAAPEALIGHSANFGSFRSRPDEIVGSPPGVDGFTLATRDFNGLRYRIKELIRYVQPDIVHVHHVLNWGIEILDLFARSGARVLMTLHEFILMCHQNGQMITPSGELCSEASPADCSRCFPSVTPGKFFIRAAMIQRPLERVDAFVSPSRFLVDRFAAWGIAREKIAVIENVLNPVFESTPGTLGGLPPGPIPSRRKAKTVVGYFGQINPFKGVDVLLQAYAMVSARGRAHLDVRVFGENKHWRDGEFDRRLQALFEEAGGGVKAFGGYRNEDVLKLMRQCDWVVVPSIWWENSPVVIQEAKLAGCRLICSDIGGMSEKADDGVDLTFPAGNPAALAQLLEEIVENPVAGDELKRRGARASAVRQSQRGALDAHLDLYRSLLSRERNRVRETVTSLASPA